MARDRVFINSEYRSLLEEMDNKDLLGQHTSEAKDTFMLAVALGIDAPAQSVEHRDGYFRMQYLKTQDKALLGSVILGKAETDSEIDENADLEKSVDFCELCAETGFALLRRKINEAGGDSELLERRLLAELDLLFAKNVEDDL